MLWNRCPTCLRTYCLRLEYNSILVSSENITLAHKLPSIFKYDLHQGSRFLICTRFNRGFWAAILPCNPKLLRILLIVYFDIFDVLNALRCISLAVKKGCLLDSIHNFLLSRYVYLVGCPGFGLSSTVPFATKRFQMFCTLVLGIPRFLAVSRCRIHFFNFSTINLYGLVIFNHN